MPSLRTTPYLFFSLALLTSPAVQGAQQRLLENILEEYSPQAIISSLHDQYSDRALQTMKKADRSKGDSILLPDLFDRISSHVASPSTTPSPQVGNDIYHDVLADNADSEESSAISDDSYSGQVPRELGSPRLS